MHFFNALLYYFIYSEQFPLKKLNKNSQIHVLQ